MTQATREHGCTIRSHHLPVPFLTLEYLIIPSFWQTQLFEGEVPLLESVKLCPTHLMHAELARDAAVGQMVFEEDSHFDRRQFGRELWGWAEDASLWLRSRKDQLGSDFRWRERVWSPEDRF